MYTVHIHLILTFHQLSVPIYTQITGLLSFFFFYWTLFCGESLPGNITHISWNGGLSSFSFCDNSPASSFCNILYIYRYILAEYNTTHLMKWTLVHQCLYHNTVCTVVFNCCYRLQVFRKVYNRDRNVYFFVAPKLPLSWLAYMDIFRSHAPILLEDWAVFLIEECSYSSWGKGKVQLISRRPRESLWF